MGRTLRELAERLELIDADLGRLRSERAVVLEEMRPYIYAAASQPANARLCAHDVVDYVKSRGPVSQHDVAAHFGSGVMPAATMLARLTAEGRISRIRRGAYA